MTTVWLWVSERSSSVRVKLENDDVGGYDAGQGRGALGESLIMDGEARREPATWFATATTYHFGDLGQSKSSYNPQCSDLFGRNYEGEIDARCRSDSILIRDGFQSLGRWLCA